VIGLGKKRSRYGRFMDSRGIKQEDVRRAARLNRDTVSKAFNEECTEMRDITKRALVRAASELTGERVNLADFW
jgi:putative transcriptional regulator